MINDTVGDLVNLLQKIESQSPEAYKELCKSPLYVSRTVASVPNSYAITARLDGFPTLVIFAKGE